jgi:transcriptional regulator with XRE-family HTH domain
MVREPLDRRDLRTRTGRTASELRRALGAELRRTRLDAGLSLRALARAAEITPSHLSEIERGIAEPSLAVLASLARVLGADVSIRLFPGTGPRIRDRLQAPMVEALLREAHPSWKRLVEVPVWRPVRGVIDAVVSRSGDAVVAIEVHSELRRLEQQIRWAGEKADALPSAEAWSMLLAGAPQCRYRGWSVCDRPEPIATSRTPSSRPFARRIPPGPPTPSERSATLPYRGPDQC